MSILSPSTSATTSAPLPSLPSFYGPRSFHVSSGETITSSLLQSQSARAANEVQRKYHTREVMYGTATKEHSAVAAGNGGAVTARKGAADASTQQQRHSYFGHHDSHHDGSQTERRSHMKKRRKHTHSTVDIDDDSQQQHPDYQQADSSLLPSKLHSHSTSRTGHESSLLIRRDDDANASATNLYNNEDTNAGINTAAHDLRALMSEFDQKQLERAGHKSMMTSPIPPLQVGQQQRQQYINGNSFPVLTTPAAHSSSSNLNSTAALQTLSDPNHAYTSQWWVRLYNSAHSTNTSPYSIGNQSSYGTASNSKMQKIREEEEKRNGAAPAGVEEERRRWEEEIARGGMKSSRGKLSGNEEMKEEIHHHDTGLKKLIVSSSTNNGTATPRSSRRAHNNPHPSTAPSSTSSHHTNNSPSGVSFGRTSHTHSHSSKKSFHSSSLLHTTLKPLSNLSLSNLPETWSTDTKLVAWKRQTGKEVQQEEEEKIRREKEKLSSSDPSTSPKTHDQLAYDEIQAIKRKNLQKSSKTQFQYDRVSELHGFLSQKNIKQLLKQTNYNRRELYVIYVRFKALCALSPTPNGIDKYTFKKGVARLAVEDDRFVNRVFSLVDDDASGQIEWEEFLTAMSALEKGDPEAKTRFFFQVYDLDADGFISRSDLSTMFHSSSMLDDDETTAEVVSTFVNKVFKVFHAEESGKISFDDVMYYMKHEGRGEDVWDVFGRSMLQDFENRRG